MRRRSDRPHAAMIGRPRHGARMGLRWMVRLLLGLLLASAAMASAQTATRAEAGLPFLRNKAKQYRLI